MSPRLWVRGLLALVLASGAAGQAWAVTSQAFVTVPGGAREFAMGGAAVALTQDSNATLLNMILRKGMILVGLGLLLGVAGAYPGTLLIGQLLFETQPLDPTTYVTVAVSFALVAALACVLPAWRATRVNLVDVLRSE